MRTLFYLLPLLYGADWLWRTISQLRGFINLWEIDALALLLVSLPALLQLLYEAMPYREPQPGNQWLPKLRIATAPIPLDTHTLTEESQFSVHRVDEQGITLRRGNGWSGEQLRLENRSDGSGELRHRHLNVRLLGRGEPDAAVQQIIKRLEARRPQPLDLAAQITSRFGIVMPDALIPDKALQPLDDQGLLLGNMSEAEPALIPEQLAPLRKQPPGDYFFYGFWGYGANSHAFYYVDISDQRTLWLRLPYGGLYGDTDQQTAQINTLLQSLATRLPQVPNLQLIQNMGEGTLALTTGEAAVPWRYPEVTDLDVLLSDTPHPGV